MFAPNLVQDTPKYNLDLFSSKVQTVPGWQLKLHDDVVVLGSGQLTCAPGPATMLQLAVKADVTTVFA
jgi:hypothetical protein